MVFNPAGLEPLIPLIAGICVSIVAFGKRFNGPKYTTLKKMKWAGVFLIGFSLFRMYSNPPFVKLTSDRVVAQLKKYVTLPHEVDSETRLDDVRALAKDDIGFFYTLTALAKTDSRFDEKIANLRAYVRANACKNPSYVSLFKEGIKVTITYSTRDQTEALTLSLSQDDCR